MRPLAALVMAFATFGAGAADPGPARGPAVRHEPAQPKPDVAVLVTARLPAGTATAVLQLQPVAPGKYVARTDPAYEADWAGLPMQGDGKDGVFSARVPAAYQKHR
jgi:hypothetical protein